MQFVHLILNLLTPFDHKIKVGSQCKYKSTSCNSLHGASGNTEGKKCDIPE